MTTYLLPVGKTLEEARTVARGRDKAPSPIQNASGTWTIRKDYDGYYVVPTDDRGYESCGAFVEIVRRT